MSHIKCSALPSSVFHHHHQLFNSISSHLTAPLSSSHIHITECLKTLCHKMIHSLPIWLTIFWDTLYSRLLSKPFFLLWFHISQRVRLHFRYSCQCNHIISFLETSFLPTLVHPPPPTSTLFTSASPSNPSLPFPGFPYFLLNFSHRNVTVCCFLMFFCQVVFQASHWIMSGMFFQVI